MVVSALVQLAIAGPVGILFGLGYGTAIRVGYEQVYPALFGDKELPKNTETILKKLESFYTSVGGLEAHKFGINQGIKNALKAIDADPELVDLIKKNSSLDSQTITVNLSGTSVQTQGLGQLVPSSPDDTTVDIPPGLTMGILSYVKALADAAKNQKLDDYVKLIEMIGLNDDNLYWLVKNTRVNVNIAGHNIVILWGMLTLEYQKSLIPRFNIINQQKIAEASKSTQKGTSEFTGLLDGTQPIGVKWTKAAGQSQKMEKVRLINQIRKLKDLIRRFEGTHSQSIINQSKTYSNYHKSLKFNQQQLANLLARYRF